MSVYRVYECYPNGTFHDLNKTVKVEKLPVYGYGGGEAVIEVFKLYGFGKYIENYVSYQSGENIHIRYNYGGSTGTKDTWILKPETDEGEDK